MSRRLRLFARRYTMIGLGVLLIAASIVPMAAPTRRSQAQEGATRFAGSTRSGPLALSADDTLLAVVNPEVDTVTLFDVGGDRNVSLGEFPVGNEPNGVAVKPDGTMVYVANTIDGTVSILEVDRASDPVAEVIATLEVGTEPYGVAITPNGTKVYVTNARSNSVSVIDTATQAVITTINNIGPAVGAEPRGIAITNNGDGIDTDETVYITHFYSFANQGKLDGEDDSKTGLVTKISTQTDSVTGQIVMLNMDDTGFKAAGDAILRQPPAQGDPTFVTGAYPNQMQAIAIKNNFAYLPNVGASPNGPVRFNVSTQALVHILNTTSNTDTGQTINLHRAVANQPEGTRKTFLAIPWAIAFKTNENVGYVVSAASNVVVRIQVDPTTGAATVQNDPFDNSVLKIPVGRNPRGIVINNTDTRAYVMNYISRDVTVIDITRFPDQVIATMRSTALPAAGSPEELVLTGQELYNTSIGEFSNSFGNMSSEGWQSCAACHPGGLSDNVVWIFGAGPRRTVSQHTDFAGGTMRALNWSAIFDEQQDFELNIRGVSGGAGLLLNADGTPLPGDQIGGLLIGDPAALAVHNSTRPQLQARTPSGGLVNAWDAMVAYIRTIRAPISPLANSDDPEIEEGRQIFISNNCQTCHGGGKWSVSSLDSPITDQTQIVNGQVISQLRNVGTFNPADTNEVRANASPPLGADGFVPPSLMSVFFSPPYFHNGSAASLDEVLSDRFAAHRAAGTGGIDGLTDPESRRKLVKFLLSIDASTVPVNP